jgi:hypothetical protein
MTNVASTKSPDMEAQPFWDAAARGVLMLKRCIETGNASTIRASSAHLLVDSRNGWRHQAWAKSTPAA